MSLLQIVTAAAHRRRKILLLGMPTPDAGESTLVIADSGECPADLTPVNWTETWNDASGNPIAGLTPEFG